MDEVRAALSTRALTVVVSVREWWCHPIASRRGRKTYGAGYSSIGEVTAWDRDDCEGLKMVVVGDGGATGPGGEVDDHDAPTRWTTSASAYPSTGPLTGSSHSRRPDVQVASRAAISYTEAFLHSAVGDVHTFWVFTRSSNSWPIKVSTVNRATGAVAGGAFYRVVEVPGQQAYVTAVQDGRTIRFAAYVSATRDVHKIWLLHLNMDTLTVTSAVGSGPHVITSGSYMNVTTATPFGPETPTTGRSRRLFYPHPTTDRLLSAEWARGSEDDAVYAEAILNAGTVIYRELGVTGPHNGYTSGPAPHRSDPRVPTVQAGVRQRNQASRIADE